MTPTTNSVEVTSDYDANDIAGYIEVQYIDSNARPGHEHHEDQLLRADDVAGVASAYTSELLYSLTPAGEVIDIATDKLMNRDGSTLTFAYDYDPEALSVVEVHHIDAPRVLRSNPISLGPRQRVLQRGSRAGRRARHAGARRRAGVTASSGGRRAREEDRG